MGHIITELFVLFQSTCLREARRNLSRSAGPSSYFNPRAYVRHDARFQVLRHRVPFQSTCLREARRPRRDLRQPLRNFNPRAYVRHDPDVWVVGREVVFQSTCLREARLFRHHALTSICSFQSTCLREARPDPASSRTTGGHFNPRAYVRHDVLRSILDRHTHHFNPRAYVRHDPSKRKTYIIKLFQSTCLREARRGGRRLRSVPHHFNPRAYVRHDERLPDVPALLHISIHVPT